VRKDFESAIGIVDSSLMSGLSDAAHFGLKDRLEATRQQYLNFLFDDVQIHSFLTES